jgi:hypothetical protein
MPGDLALLVQELQTLRRMFEREVKHVAELRREIDLLKTHGISSGQLRVQSLSVMCSNRTRCSASCRFCISRTTPGEDCPTNGVQKLDLNRLQVGLEFARRAGAMTAILTGKADPLQEYFQDLCLLIKACRREMPTVDMHTNGLGFLIGQKMDIASLASHGLTMITFSIASQMQEVNAQLMGPLFAKYNTWECVKEAAAVGLLTRCSVVMNKSGVKDLNDLLNYICWARNHGTHQVVVRELWLPDCSQTIKNEVATFNRDNFLPIAPIEKQFAVNEEASLVNRLPWGQAVYDYMGVNVTFAHCAESYHGGTLKSLVHRADGHGYMDWDHKGSVLY